MTFIYIDLSASRPGEFLELFPSSSSHGTSSSSSSLSSGSSSSMIVEVSGNREWFWATNGSLILEEATPEKSGRYLCQVTNGIGQDLNQIVDFVVKGERD